MFDLRRLQRDVAKLKQDLRATEAPEERVRVYIPRSGRDPHQVSAPDDAVQLYDADDDGPRPWEEPPCP